MQNFSLITSLERPECRREVNIKVNLKAVEGEGDEWIYLARERDQWRAVVNTTMNLRVS
jgi:hypothetical protein